MATLGSRPWNQTYRGHDHTWPSCPREVPKNFSYAFGLMKAKSRRRFGGVGLAPKWQLLEMGIKRKGIRVTVAKGYDGLDPAAGVNIPAEEDEKFVEVLREVQPYIFLHRSTTFVVVIACEIVASLFFLDAILQRYAVVIQKLQRGTVLILAASGVHPSTHLLN